MTPLERVRTTRGFTKTDVARAVGCDKSHYGNIEAGKASASPALARKIVGFLGKAITEHQVLYPQDYALAATTESAEAS